jgi:hypothetical protein
LISLLVSASLASWYASSMLCGQLVPVVSSVCLDPVEFYFPVLHPHHFRPDFSNFFRFLSDSNVIRLSVDINTVLSIFSKYCGLSSAFNIASCSAWLFEHRPFNLYFVVTVKLHTDPV